MEIRGKINHFGPASMTTEQLFMLIVGSGTKQYPVEQIVQQLAYRSKNFTDLAALNVQTLLQIPGIGQANQGRILALLELMQRLKTYRWLPLQQPVAKNTIIQHLVTKYFGYQQEELMGFFLDVNQSLLVEKILFWGTLTMATVHPREIIKTALMLPCVSLVIAHNHPSGNLAPSQADLMFTQRLQSCCQLFNLNLLDHLIIGQDNFLSFQDRGLL